MLKPLNRVLARYLGLVFLLLFYACGSEEKIVEPVNSDGFRSYPINIEKKPIQFVEAFESVEFLQLEETEESLLNSVTRLTRTGDKLIFPGYNDGNVYLFSNRGEFLHKFNNQGEAEGQYGSIQDLWVEGESIVVYDSKKTTAYWYDFEGNYQKMLEMPEGTGHMFPLGNSYMTDMSFGPMSDTIGHKINVLGGGQELTNQLLPFTKRISFPMGRNTNSFKLYDGKTIFKAVYADTTYFVDGEQAVPFIHIDFGDKYLWKDESLFENLIGAMQAIPKGEGVWNYTPYVHQRFIYMIYNLSLKDLAAIIDRETGEYHLIETFKRNEERFDLMPIAWEGDKLLFSMPPDNVAELLDGLEDGQWQFREGATLESIESSENPVLMWAKFKDFSAQ